MVFNVAAAGKEEALSPFLSSKDDQMYPMLKEMRKEALKCLSTAFREMEHIRAAT